jgi:ABC-type multidrug transport system ATPase subunit
MKNKFRLSTEDSDVSLITFTNIEKRYGKQCVLSIDKFSLHNNDFVVLKGPNGAGKSTFLKLLSGVSLPSSGCLNHSTKYLNLRKAFVPQTGGLLRNLSVMENLEVLCRMYGRSIDTSLFDQWYIQDLDLTEHIHKPINTLSGGFQKIAAISCTLATEPAGLFIDEPFNGVDNKKVDLLANNLMDFAKANAFVVITTHQDVESVTANQIVSLAKGCWQ